MRLEVQARETFTFFYRNDTNWVAAQEFLIAASQYFFMCSFRTPAEGHVLAQSRQRQTFAVGAGGKEGTFSWIPCPD